MEIDNRLGSCSELRQRYGLKFDCCNSCHEEENLGYEMAEIETDEGYYLACCTAIIAFDKKEKCDEI